MNRPLALLAASLLFAAPAAADTPIVDLYGGYSILNDDELEETFTKGFVLSLGFNISDSVAIPLEFSWHSKDFEVLDEDVASTSIKTYMAGFRFGRRFHIQVLAGGATASVDIGGVEASDTEFAIQPGLGFDIPIGSTVGIRLGGDYRRIFSDPGVNEWRGHVGIVVSLGSR